MSLMFAGIARLLVLIPADRVPIITPVNHDKTDAENLREDWQRIGPAACVMFDPRPDLRRYAVRSMP